MNRSVGSDARKMYEQDPKRPDDDVDVGLIKDRDDVILGSEPQPDDDVVLDRPEGYSARKDDDLLVGLPEGYEKEPDDLELPEREDDIELPEREDDVELDEPEDFDVEEVAQEDIESQNTVDVEGEDIPMDVFDVPEMDPNIDLIAEAEKAVANAPDVFAKADAEKYGIDDETYGGYIAARKNLAFQLKNLALHQDYLETFAERNRRVKQLESKGAKDPNADLAKEEFTAAKQDMVQIAIDIDDIKKQVQEYEMRFKAIEAAYWLGLPAIESNEEQEERIEDAETEAVSKGFLTRKTAKELGLEKEHQESYIPARQQLFILESDIKLLLDYKKQLRERKSQLKKRGIKDVYDDKADAIHKAINEELAEKTKTMKELKEKVETFEDEFRKAVHRKETGMPATTNIEALAGAAKDLGGLALAAAAIEAKASVVAARAGYEVTKAGTKATAKVPKKVAKAGGTVASGVAGTGFIGTGVIAGAFIGIAKAIREIFTGKKPDQK